MLGFLADYKVPLFDFLGLEVLSERVLHGFPHHKALPRVHVHIVLLVRGDFVLPSLQFNPLLLRDGHLETSWFRLRLLQR